MPNDNPFQPLTFGDQVADQTGLIPRKTRPVVTPIFPVPDDAWSIDLYVHYKHGKPSAVWPYFDAEGKLVAFAARFDFIDSQGKPKKDVIPVCWCRVQWPTGRPKNEWQEIAAPEPRLLFNLRELILNPTAPVVFCEGEKKALIVPQRFPGYVGTTTMGGANAANLSEFSPLAGRSVTGWPDNDEAGHGYINDIAARATHAGASVKIVTVPPGLPPKWDIADELPAGYTPEQMFEALRSAAPWQAPQPTDHEREDAELRQVSEMYPLPALDRPLSYARTATGEIWAHKEIEKKEGPEVLPVISPFTITARLRRI